MTIQRDNLAGVLLQEFGGHIPGGGDLLRALLPAAVAAVDDNVILPRRAAVGQVPVAELVAVPQHACLVPLLPLARVHWPPVLARLGLQTRLSNTLYIYLSISETKCKARGHVIRVYLVRAVQPAFKQALEHLVRALELQLARLGACSGSPAGQRVRRSSSRMDCFQGSESVSLSSFSIM